MSKYTTPYTGQMRLTTVYWSHTSIASRKHITHSHSGVALKIRVNQQVLRETGLHLVRIWELMLRSWGSFGAQRFQGNTWNFGPYTTVCMCLHPFLLLICVWVKNVFLLINPNLLIFLPFLSLAKFPGTTFNSYLSFLESLVSPRWQMQLYFSY